MTRELINLALSRTGLYSSNQISTWLINNGAFQRSLLKKKARVENYLWLGSIRRCTVVAAVDNGIIISLSLFHFRYVTEFTDERSYRLHTVARMQSSRIRSSERMVARRGSYSTKVLPGQKDHPAAAGQKRKDKVGRMHPALPFEAYYADNFEICLCSTRF